MEDLSEKRIKIYRDYLDKKKWVKQEMDNILWANQFYLDDIEKLL
jgi:starch phosphorylase